MNDPEFWRWVWLAAAVTFGVGEMTSPGSFFLAPFGIGAAAAAVLSFLGAPIALGWLVFVLVSGGSFMALRPLARRLDAAGPNPRGIGAGRLIGEHGVVLEAVPDGPDALGLVRVGREEWRAQSADNNPIPTGTSVTVIEMKGTRVIVYPTGPSIPQMPPLSPPDQRAEGTN